jgi:hypothetical protein
VGILGYSGTVEISLLFLLLFAAGFCLNEFFFYNSRADTVRISPVTAVFG